MNFIDIIKARGFVHQMTDEAGLRQICDLTQSEPRVAYIGFDCTAKSLHVGSLLQIMLLRWWQKCGHRPIVLLGGGTTKIGDPSGKDESRPRLDDAAIAENMESLKLVFGQFLEFDSEYRPRPNAALMVNNDDWLKDLNYVDFLRDYGSHFSVNRMMSMDSVKLRLEREQNLSFLEFNYMILQAYDFVELNRRFGCCVQMGGSDQWGNIINGIDLHLQKAKKYSASKQLEADLEYLQRYGAVSFLRKTFPQDFAHLKIVSAAFSEVENGVYNFDFQYITEMYGITSPLITTSSGAKMGKTASGAVWLNDDLCSPYDYWQFWRNTEDGDVIRFLKLFTELPLEQIAEYEGWLGSSKINEAKIILATEATTLLHGSEAAERAAKTAADTFSGTGFSVDLPQIIIHAKELPLYELLVKVGFATSNGEARRLIKGNGISLNGIKVADENAFFCYLDCAEGFAKLSKGKKQHVLVKLA